MRKRFTPILKLSLLITCLITNISIFAQIDLELSLSQSNDNPTAWSNFTVTAQLINKGTSAAQNIAVAIPMVDNTKYQGGNEYTATVGSFSPYGSQQWTLQSLGANQSATLTINLFATANAPSPSYAQVMQASPNDTDSTPGNGNGFSVNEDDEALSVGGGGNPVGNKADLAMSDITIQNSASPGDVISYTFDLENKGSTTANGDFRIAVYLSNNPGASGSLTEVGVINTGNIGVGTIQDVAGAISIPANYPTGTSYVVFVIDADNDIDESNENNNVKTRALALNDNGGPTVDDFCGFEKTFFELNPAVTQDPAQREVIASTSETSDGYAIKVTESNTEYRDLLISTDGDLISFNPNGMPPTFQVPTLPSGATYDINALGPNSFQIEVNNPNGQLIFNKTYTDVTSSNANPQALLRPRIFEKSNGYYLMGTWVNPNNGLATLYLITLNSNGVIQQLFEEQLTIDFYSFNYIGILPNDDLLFTVDNNSTRSINYARININGFIFNNNIIGDLVSNRVPQVDYVPAENAVYMLIYNDPWSEIRKVSTETGEIIWTTRLTDAFNPNSAIIRILNRTNRMILTDDGGAIVAYRYNNPVGPNGTEIGKLDSDGNAVWWKSYDETYNVRAAIETNDGGFLFTGRKGNEFTLLKLNDMGDPLPACNDNGGSGEIDLSLAFDENSIDPDIWTNFSTILTISNSGSETATGVKVKINQPGNLVFQGGNEFSISRGTFQPYGNKVWNIGSLAAGASASLQINYFLTNNNPMTVFAEVIGTNEEDGDSSPNNGSIGSQSEDDEANLFINENNGQNSRFNSSDLGQNRAYVLNNIYPNPAGGENVNFVISSALEATTTLNIYNSNGQLVYAEEIEPKQGSNQVSISTENFNSGLHYIQILGTHSKSATGSFYIERL